LHALQHRLAGEPAGTLRPALSATARWQSQAAQPEQLAVHIDGEGGVGLGAALRCDMSREFGGAGQGPTAAWLFRASIAACAVTSVVLRAAQKRLPISRVEARVDSESDLRGMFGMADDSGAAVPAAPRNMRLVVHVRSDHADAPALRELVRQAVAMSPVPCAVHNATALALHVEVAPQ
jgi:uncharacterized OsmC-like protein